MVEPNETDRVRHRCKAGLDTPTETALATFRTAFLSFRTNSFRVSHTRADIGHFGAR
jgi:hypothetical protein